MRRKVLLLQPIHEAGMSVLEARDDVRVSLASDPTQETLVREVRDAHAILARATPVTRSMIDAAGELCVVSRHGVGYDNVDVERLTERGIPLAIAIEANALSVAEHAMYLILALAKRGFAFDRAIHAGNFAIRESMRGMDIAGKSLLLIGFGRTGTRVAAFARGFDMRVLVYDPYIEQATISAAGCTAVDDYRSVLGDVDAISIHCPLTEETRNMFDAREFGVMKSSAFVVNCARGGIVNEPALCDALRRGDVAGAGLDVFLREPLPGDDPLLGLDNVITSPHIAGVTLEASVRMATGAARNILAAFDGTLDPAAVVNPEVLTTRGDIPRYLRG